MNTVSIARICHEANRAYCEEVMNDKSQKPWDEAEEWQRDSAIKGVVFSISNPNLTPEDQHNAWMADKLKAGWSYGPEKDPDNRKHPCMVEYADLPADQKGKDILFRAIALGLQSV